MIVVDASLASKWHLAEADSSAALAFLEAREAGICGPDLLAIEVCGAIVMAANMRRIGRQSAEALIAGWLAAIDRGDIRLYPSETRLAARAADIALDLGHPLADCLYLALAVDLGAELATCDAKFVAKARPAYSAVRLLSEFD